LIVIVEIWLKDQYADENDIKSYGSEEDELRKNYKNNPEVVEMILTQRENNNMFMEIEAESNEDVALDVPSVYWDCFNFYVDYLMDNDIYEYGGMGGILKWDWNLVRFLSDTAFFTLDIERINQLRTIQTTVVSFLNEKHQKEIDNKT